MKSQIETIRKIRQAILKFVEDMPIETLNQVPEGFNNNLIWNIAHLIAAQENLFYAKAGLAVNVSQDFFDSYKPGSKPEKFVSESEVLEIKKLLLTSLDQLQEDIETNIFSSYQPWLTRYGVEIKGASDALLMIPFHDGLHFGYMMAMKRALNAQK